MIVPVLLLVGTVGKLKMTPEEREAAMLEYRRRNDEEEIRLRGVQGALDAKFAMVHAERII